MDGALTKHIFFSIFLLDNQNKTMLSERPIYGLFLKYEWVKARDCNLGQNVMAHGTLCEKIRYFIIPIN
jgi:hypothetical protein